MDSTVPNATSPRTHPRWWAFNLISGTVLFYFLIRECFTPRTITLGQQVFILGYALLIAFGYTIRMTRMMLGATPPRWLDAWWKRFAACLIGILVLTGLVAVLPLPTFYSHVLQHTVMFLVLPVILNGRLGIRTSRWLDGPPAPSARAASLAQDTERDVVLHLSRRRAVFVLVGSALFVAAGWWMHFEAPVVAWIGIAFFGLGIPLGLLMLLPGFSYLKLQRDGFTVRHTWRQYTFGWDEISDLTVVTFNQGSRVAFNIHKPGARRSTMLREMYGRDMMLVDNYSLSASDLCALMQARQAAATHPSA